MTRNLGAVALVAGALFFAALRASGEAPEPREQRPAATQEQSQSPDAAASVVKLWRAINACVTAGGAAVITSAGGGMARFECVLPGDDSEKKD